MFNWYTSRRRGELSGLDPWDARTIEWTTPNPTPEYNFATAPVVLRLDHFWHLKYTEDEEGRAVRRPEASAIIADLEYDGRNPSQPIHLPAPSYFPILMALGIPLMFYGVIYHTSGFGKALIGIGALVSLTAVIGWAMEPIEEASPAGAGDAAVAHATAPDEESADVETEAELEEAEFEEVPDE